MDFDNVVIKDSPGLCRCCLSEGCYKDLGSEYIWMGEPEIYAEMLLECFDISISQHNNGPNGPNRLICEVCITRLRDACNFKKQVMDSERKFVDMLARGDFIAKVSNNAPMKAETSEAEAIEEDHIEVEYLENDMEYDYEDIKEEDSDGEIKEKPARASATSTRKAREEPKRKKTQTESKQRVRKTTKKEKRMPTDQQTVNRVQIRKNLEVLLVITNVMPFRWHGNKYQCFYCQAGFSESDNLRQHTKDDHEGCKLNNYLLSVTGKTTIKLDISNMSCKCSANFRNFEDLNDHVIAEHKASYDKSFNDFFECFKLSDDISSCPICGSEFRFFGSMLVHIRQSHPKMKLCLCDLCGVGFNTQSKLRDHIKRTHSRKGFKCKYCDETFQSPYHKKSHQDLVHRTEKLQCRECSKTFTSAYKKQCHIEFEHGTIKYKCDKCSAVFINKSRLVTHDRRMHLKEKNHICALCGERFFTKHNLKLHMVSHGNDRPFGCDICNKSFARKKNLEIHTRIHTNDRRCVCVLCDKAFIQTASLKFHIRKHHPKTAV